VRRKNWQGKTGGGNFGQQFLLLSLKHGNINFIYFIVAIVALFYFAFNFFATKNIYQYFRKRHGYSIVRSLSSTYWNNFLFAKTLVDKFAIFAGRVNDYTVEEINSNLFADVINNPEKGAIIINSHVGCAEIAGYILSQNKKKMNALVYGGETIVIQEHRSKILEKRNMSIIPVVDAFSHIFAINEALKNAELISMHGDRTYENSKNIICNFLGTPAAFPIGPFQLAVKYKVPLLALFVMQNGHKKYKSYVIPIEISNQENYTDKQQIELLLKRYASALEDIVKQYPAQWYNFHKFWI
jgi:predicted LPLAT superfamily acyltransferase